MPIPLPAEKLPFISIGKISLRLAFAHWAAILWVAFAILVRLSFPHQNLISLMTATNAFWTGGKLALCLWVIGLPVAASARSTPEGRTALRMLVVSLVAAATAAIILAARMGYL